MKDREGMEQGTDRDETSDRVSPADGEGRGAAEWFLAIQAESDPDPQTVQAWLQWMDASEDNRRAFEDIAYVWQRTPSAVMPRATGPAADEDYDGALSVAEWRARTSGRLEPVRATQTARQAPERRRRFSARAAIAAAASFGAVALLLHWATRPVAIQEGAFSTGTNEQRQLSLADGSEVTLGAHSRLVVRLDGRTRDLRLESGEAYFSVRKDPQRPFVVTALDSAITAVGTAFNVRAVQDRVTVTVSEGRVTAGESLLERGEQITLTQGAAGTPRPEIRRRVDAEESTRWREGWLVYREEPLRYVMADIARYTKVPLTMSDSAAEVRFSGTVFKDNIEEWIAALPNVVAVSVRREGEGFRIVERAGAAKAGGDAGFPGVP